MNTTGSATHNHSKPSAASLDGRSASVVAESKDALGFFFGYRLGLLCWVIQLRR